INIIGNLIKITIPDNIVSNVLQIGEVPHSKAIAMSLEADVLVVVHPIGRKGVYTGKLFDYLATNKPILALCDPQDVVGALLNETKSGFVVDEADIAGIKKMILRCYSIWKNKEVLPRDWGKIRQYTRQNQAQILLNYLSKNVALHK
ncbi:MAG: glycosyl transferase, partial [Bacteroidaceae bacterium]|nr:glycosyl transferase [Bacteroidaceae bacterium]